MTRPVRVVMIGPEVTARGGMSSVMQLILLHMPEEGVAMVPLPTYGDGPRWRRPGTFAAATAAFAGMLARGAVDVAHVHVSAYGSVARKGVIVQMAQSAGVPVLLHMHGGRFPDTLAAWPAPACEAVRRVYGRAEGLIALSNSWKAYYQEALGLPEGRVSTLPNPVAYPAAVPARPERETLAIAFTGHMIEEKGIFELVAAFASLPEPLRRRTRLLLAGDAEAEALARARALGVAERVEFLGWLDPARRDALLAEADVFALPSHNEALPMSLLEAMAAALPVVTTPVGGIPEIVEHDRTGLMVPPGDVPALAAALERLLVSAELRRSLGLAGRRRVEPLNAVSYARTLADHYRRLAAQRRDPSMRSARGA